MTIMNETEMLHQVVARHVMTADQSHSVPLITTALIRNHIPVNLSLHPHHQVVLADMDQDRIISDLAKILQLINIDHRDQYMNLDHHHLHVHQQTISITMKVRFPRIPPMDLNIMELASAAVSSTDMIWSDLMTTHAQVDGRCNCLQVLVLVMKSTKIIVHPIDLDLIILPIGNQIDTFHHPAHHMSTLEEIDQGTIPAPDSYPT